MEPIRLPFLWSFFSNSYEINKNDEVYTICTFTRNPSDLLYSGPQIPLGTIDPTQKEKSALTAQDGEKWYFFYTSNKLPPEMDDRLNAYGPFEEEEEAKTEAARLISLEV